MIDREFGLGDTPALAAGPADDFGDGTRAAGGCDSASAPVRAELCFLPQRPGHGPVQSTARLSRQRARCCREGVGR